MPSIKFDFNREKAIESILYIANRVRDPSRITILKLLYLADKMSLERWGRFIAGDTYCAMKHGPVGSETYNLIKIHEQFQDLFDPPFKTSGTSEKHIEPQREANIDVLSESDTECLDEVIAEFGNLNRWAVRDVTHDAAYNRIWKASGEKGSTPIPVEDIIEQFAESKDLLDYLENAHSD